MSYSQELSEFHILATNSCLNGRPPTIEMGTEYCISLIVWHNNTIVFPQSLLEDIHTVALGCFYENWRVVFINDKREAQSSAKFSDMMEYAAAPCFSYCSLVSFSWYAVSVSSHTHTHTFISRRLITWARFKLSAGATSCGAAVSGNAIRTRTDIWCSTCQTDGDHTRVFFHHQASPINTACYNTCRFY